MKTVILVVVNLLFWGFIAQAQKLSEDEVPEGVVKTFRRQFERASKVSWIKSVNEYEAAFKFHNLETVATYTSEGVWVKTETEITPDELPSSVSDSLKANFRGYKVSVAQKIASPKMSLGYQIEIKKGDSAYEILYDRIGKLVNKTNVGEGGE